MRLIQELDAAFDAEVQEIHLLGLAAETAGPDVVQVTVLAVMRAKQVAAAVGQCNADRVFTGLDRQRAGVGGPQQPTGLAVHGDFRHTGIRTGKAHQCGTVCRCGKAAAQGDLTGKELERRLDEVYITANKNTIPNEQRSPFVTSGVRLGTPAVTTRGLKEEDMDVIAECIYLCATDFENSADLIREKVTTLLEKYPLYI